MAPSKGWLLARVHCGIPTHCWKDIEQRRISRSGSARELHQGLGWLPLGRGRCASGTETGRWRGTPVPPSVTLDSPGYFDSVFIARLYIRSLLIRTTPRQGWSNFCTATGAEEAILR